MNLIQYILLLISAASIIAMPGFWDVVKSVVGRGDQSREILASASVIGTRLLTALYPSKWSKIQQGIPKKCYFAETSNLQVQQLET